MSINPNTRWIPQLDLPEYMDHKLLLGDTTAIQQGVSMVEFTGTDSSELFNKNISTKPWDWPYRSKTINYKLNPNGYRAPKWEDVNWSQSVIILGCSMTFGVGVAEDETIAWNLSQILNRPVINLGIGGSSVLFSAYNSLLVHERFGNPWAVVNMWTDVNRLPVFTARGIHHHGSWNMGKDSLMDHWTYSTVNAPIHAQMMVGLIRELWKGKTQYWEGSFFDHTAEYLKIERVFFSDRARDDLHIGPLGTLKTAQIIAEKLG